MSTPSAPPGERGAALASTLFAAAWYKGEHVPSIVRQIDLPSEWHDDSEDYPAELRKPGHDYWLDTVDHRGEPNGVGAGRNSSPLGVGHYSEEDIKNAFTCIHGLDFTQPIPLTPSEVRPSSSTVKKTTTSQKRPSWGETATSMAKIIIDITSVSPPRSVHCPLHLTTFSSLTSLQVQLGT